MSQSGSGSLPATPVHPLVGLAAAIAGTAAMLSAGQVLGGHLPVRASITIGSALLALPALLSLALLGRPLTRTLALRPADNRTVRLTVAMGASLWLASLGLLELQYTVWPPPPGYLELFRRIHEALRPANPLDAVLSVIAIAAAPALFEETLVRGVVLPSFRPVLGATMAVIASALLFALMHADPYRLAFTFAVGIALGVVRLRANALLPCILVHGTLNTLTFLAAPFVDDPSEPLPAPRPLLGAAFFAVGVAVTILLLRRLREAPPEQSSSDAP